MTYDSIIACIQQIGFPIAVSLYLMIRVDRLLSGIREELIKNGDMLRQIWDRK